MTSPRGAMAGIRTPHGAVGLWWSQNDEGRVVIHGLELLPGDPPAARRLPLPVRRLLDQLRRGLPASELAWVLGHLDWSGVTPFRRRVLETLFESVGPGETITYGQLAARIGTPTAARAVGQAMRHNPFPALIPCHRCLSAAGLGGFMGNVRGADERKRAMLAVEGRAVD